MLNILSRQGLELGNGMLPAANSSALLRPVGQQRGLLFESALERLSTGHYLSAEPSAHSRSRLPSQRTAYLCLARRRPRLHFKHESETSGRSDPQNKTSILRGSTQRGHFSSPKVGCIRAVPGDRCGPDRRARPRLGQRFGARAPAL